MADNYGIGGNEEAPGRGERHQQQAQDIGAGRGLLEREVRHDRFDRRRLAGEDLRHPSGRNAARALAPFELGAPENAACLGGDAAELVLRPGFELRPEIGVDAINGRGLRQK